MTLAKTLLKAVLLLLLFNLEQILACYGWTKETCVHLDPAGALLRFVLTKLLVCSGCMCVRLWFVFIALVA